MKRLQMTNRTQPFPIALAIFPLLEGVFFIEATQHSHPVAVIALLIASAVMLSFSIHIFFHECVHYRARYPQTINLLYSLFLGLPFDGYRVHHLNHHTYENGLKDFSSTWKRQQGENVAHSVCRYSLGWLRQLKAAMRAPHPFDPRWGNVVAIKSRIPIQKIALVVFSLLLVLIDLKLLLLYGGLIYLGWAFSSLHNYGQHPPTEQSPICTYPSKIYNQLFFNNGLHWEHHQQPQHHWDQIKLASQSPRIPSPHLINPCATKLPFLGHLLLVLFIILGIVLVIVVVLALLAALSVYVSCSSMTF